MPIGASTARVPAAALLLAAVLFVPQIPAAHAGQRRPVSAKDLMQFTWVADPRISPDGKRVAFVRITVNRKKNGYDTAIWIVPAGGQEPPRPFTAGRFDSAPRWSADGRRLAFLRAPDPEAVKDGGKEGKPPPQIHVMSAEGGEARSLTDLPKGAGSPEWSPDGKTIAFTSTTTAEDLARQQARRAGRSADDDDDRESDVRVIARAAYRMNEKGYRDPRRRSHVWTIAVPPDGEPAPEPRALTAGDFDEDNVTWAPDGSRLYFTSDRVVEPYYQPPDADLYSVPAAGGEITRVASIDGSIGPPAPSRDGRRIAFVGTANGSPVRSYNQPDLFVVDARPGSTPRNLTAGYDFDVGGGLAGDQQAPRGSSRSIPIWNKDLASLIVVAAEHGRANLVRVDATSGKVAPVTSGAQDVAGWSATHDGSTLALLVGTATRIGDLQGLAPGRKPVPLTRFNDRLYAELDLAPPEEIWYRSFDGRRIQAWVQKPPGFDQRRKYPLILNIHGGPHAAWGHTFMHEFHLMAAEGFVVLYPNPRGSTSYGQEFGNVIQHRYPGDDHKDLMAGVDELVRRGTVDPERLGVTGGSGGGLLTNWAVTQTDRFKAAVSQRSISDWAGFWYTADFTLFTPSWFRDVPFRDPQEYTSRSPLTFVEKITTPLMLIEGEADYRTPPAEGGEALFRALKYLRRPAVMVRFPDESHELSRSGKPRHRVERLQHIVAWFQKYLQGKAVATYDVR